MPLYINRFKTKHFPIETFLEMIDSSVRSPGEVLRKTLRTQLRSNRAQIDQSGAGAGRRGGGKWAGRRRGKMEKSVTATIS